jgi:hypothetical protein
MTSISQYEVDVERLPRGTGRRHPPAWWTVTMALVLLVGLAVIAAACSASDGPGIAGSGSKKGDHTPAPTGSSSQVSAQAVAYAHCMRDHGLSEFPDPTVGPGGDIAFQLDGGRGSELNQDNSRFKAAQQVCRSLFPGGGQPAPLGAQKIAAEVEWAGCMRSHGLPGFPDPNARGAFDSSRFDDSSSAFQTASEACRSMEPAGPMSAVPGHGNES